METISGADCMRQEGTLYRAKEDRNIVHGTK
jgi:hypothetical protein